MSLPPPAPAPAPPPPPVRTLSSNSNFCSLFIDKAEPGGLVLDSTDTTNYMCVGQVGLSKHREQIERNEQKEDDANIVYLSYHRAVVPIMQKGPLCGLVAAAMALPLLQTEEVTVEELLEKAIEQGLTKQGEMFSVTDMSCLLQSVLPDSVQSEVITNWDEPQVLQFLLQSDLVLIPYDADKNHSPCQKKGHKAHWMLITGCFLAVNNSENIFDMTMLEDDEDYYERNLYHLKPGTSTTTDILSKLRQRPDKIVDVLVYGQQGKSRHTGVWTVEELLASNSQLLELGSQKNDEEYVIPKGGVEEGLCGQIVHISQL